MNKRIHLKTRIVAMWFLLFTAHLALADERSLQTQEPLPVFRMWLGAGLPKMQTYDQSVVEVALEHSREKFGAYIFITEIATNTIKRQERIFHTSENISINVSPMNSYYNDEVKGSHLAVPFPIAKGMLGYRQLLIRKERLSEFERIKTLKKLQRYSIGQVSGWADVNVLEENNIKVQAVPKYELLFPMLNNQRFDTISVGCTEVPALLNFLEKNYPDKFAIVPDLVLFYPFALYIFMNKGQTDALARLSYGYDHAHKAGEIDKLFDSYHGEIFKKLKTPNLTIIKLKNTQISARGASAQPRLLE